MKLLRLLCHKVPPGLKHFAIGLVKEMIPALGHRLSKIRVAALETVDALIQCPNKMKCKGDFTIRQKYETKICNLHILKYEKEDLENLSNYQVQYEFKDQELGFDVKICTLIGKPLTVILLWSNGTTEGMGTTIFWVLCNCHYRIVTSILSTCYETIVASFC